MCFKDTIRNKINSVSWAGIHNGKTREFYPLLASKLASIFNPYS